MAVLLLLCREGFPYLPVTGRRWVRHFHSWEGQPEGGGEGSGTLPVFGRGGGH